MTFKPEDPETINRNAAEVSAKYAETFRDKWNEIQNIADWKKQYSATCEFVHDLLAVIQREHYDHCVVVAQCINIQNWLAQKAGIGDGGDKNVSPWVAWHRGKA